MDVPGMLLQLLLQQLGHRRALLRTATAEIVQKPHLEVSFPMRQVEEVCLQLAHAMVLVEIRAPIQDRACCSYLTLGLRSKYGLLGPWARRPL